MRFYKKLGMMLFHRKSYRLIKKLNAAGNSVSFDSSVTEKTVLEGKNKIRHATVNDSEIGYLSYVGSGSFLPKTKIGRYSSIAFNVVVEPATHSTDLVSSHPHFETNEQFLTTENGYYCEIGNDVWIGRNVLIKGGVKIGDGAVVGMGSIVTKDVPPYAIVAGCPAKLIRYRFDEETVKKLLGTKWWERAPEEIESRKDLFGDPDAFVRSFTDK